MNRCPTASCAALHAFPAIPGKPVNCRKCRKLVDLWDSVLQVRQCEHQYHSAMVLAMVSTLRDCGPEQIRTRIDLIADD